MPDLNRKNIEHSIMELQDDEEVLGKYRDRGFFSLQEAMDWLEEELIDD